MSPAEPPRSEPAPTGPDRAPANGPSQRDAEAKRTYRIGWRMAGLGWEFVSHVLAGTLIGWGIDYYFSTRPWGIAIGAVAGLAVGMLQFIRAATKLNAQMGPVKSPPGGWKEVPFADREGGGESGEDDAPSRSGKPRE